MQNTRGKINTYSIKYLKQLKNHFLKEMENSHEYQVSEEIDTIDYFLDWIYEKGKVKPKKRCKHGVLTDGTEFCKSCFNL